MRLRSILRRTRVSALAVGLATAGALALSTPASAATQDVTATLRVTIATNSDCVFVGRDVDGNRQYSRHRGFAFGQTKDIVVTVSAGEYLQVYNSRGCYGVNGVILGVIVQHDGEVIPLTL